MYIYNIEMNNNVKPSNYHKPNTKYVGFQRRPFKDNRPSLPPKEQLQLLTTLFINNNSTSVNSEYELEAKFGTRGIKPITKLDYDNVVKKLKSIGFKAKTEIGNYSLKIQSEFLDVNTGEYKTAGDFERLRIEINGLNNIQTYCRTNNLQDIITLNYYDVKLMRKTDIKISEDSNDNVQSALFDDFNFSVTLKKEETISKTGKLGLEIFDGWNQSRKIFRYINRVGFTHPDYPFYIDLSIVRSSTKDDRKRMIKVFNVADSNVFDNQDTYEIEIEANKKLPSFIHYSTPEKLSGCLQKIVKFVLSGLQKTNYPISYPEQKLVASNYLRLIFEEEFKLKREIYNPKDRLYPSDFIGPGLKTLEIQNIGPINSGVSTPNITEPYSYCVTEKADGDRHVLYVNDSGKIYLINMNMNVIFTGAITYETKCFNSMLDGELILHNKEGLFINRFAAFDIYYINNVDIRARPFVKIPTKDKKYFEEGCRLPILKEFVKILSPVSILLKKEGPMDSINNKSPIFIFTKNFYPLFDSTEEKDTEKEKGVDTDLTKYNIFEASNYILRRIADNLFDYDIDGLIFTPTTLGVGSSKFLEAGPKHKKTWNHCFKWKPSEATKIFPKSFNTIDFLVFTKKAADGSEIITPIFENGLDVNKSTQYNQYKTLILCVGFDENKHGYINPCQDLLDDRFNEIKDTENENDYKAKQFFPSDPYDPKAGLCNMMLTKDDHFTYQMFTEEGQVFGDKTVVEFRYDITKPGLWKWIPLRVRYDKTAEYKQGLNSFGNDYVTANNNWHSIHNPVTEKMIATGGDIPGIEISDDVYYNSVTDEKQTKGLRDFHNLVVKKLLIQAVSKRGNILIDFSCGKGGDIPKWISSNLSFVFGIDISKDNIENRLNGACTRFLNYKKTTPNMPYALFVNGDSSLNIRSGTNMFTDKSNLITKNIFGENTGDNSVGPAVLRQKGIGISGFDVSSCQFSMHYLFENNKTFYNFIRNVAECTKLNGYYIGTCYDGKTIFNMLKKKTQGESVEIYNNDKKIWSVTKQYSSDLFEDNDSSLGYKIDVYQDSINQTIPEWLVNFDLLTNTMEKYGFTLITRDEARHIGLPEGSGMFNELYNKMINEIKKNPSKENDYGTAPFMYNYEKDISFLNRYFVYKKTSTRNTEQLTKIILEQLPGEIEFEEAGTMLAREAVKKAEEELKPRAKLLGQKLKLQEATEALEETELAVVTKVAKKTRTKKIKDSVVNQETQIVDNNVVIIKPNKVKVTRKKKEETFELEPVNI
jgi:hypothetical protein